MRRALPLLLAMLLSAPAMATDTYLGTITSTGASTTNLTTATPFQLQAGWRISIQCDNSAGTYIAEAPAPTPPTVTTANGLFLSTQYGLFDVVLTDMRNASAQYFAVGILPASGTSNCKVFLSSP